MGSGRYSFDEYSIESHARGISASTASSEVFSSSLKYEASLGSLNVNARTYNTVKQEMVDVGVRECRDSEEHPETTPIIIALDVTGSMRDTPYVMIKEYLPKIMDELLQLGVKDPQLLFMAVGDHTCDRYPIQVGQFESTAAKIMDSLQSFVLEGGGGPNYGESYCLAWLVAGYHTETDSWFKRGKKGFLFTIGDEPTLTSVEADYLVNRFGYKTGAQDMSAEEMLEKAKEQYHVYHIHITDAWKRLQSEAWSKLLGPNVLQCKSTEIDTCITGKIGELVSDYVSEEVEMPSETFTY